MRKLKLIFPFIIIILILSVFRIDARESQYNLTVHNLEQTADSVWVINENTNNIDFSLTATSTGFAWNIDKLLLSQDDQNYQHNDGFQCSLSYGISLPAGGKLAGFLNDFDSTFIIKKAFKICYGDDCIEIPNADDYVPGANFKVTEHRMTNDPENALCGLTYPPEVTTFDANKDEIVALYFTIDGVEVGNVQKVQWISPDSQLYYESTYTYEQGGSLCNWSGMYLKDSSAAYKGGNWRVDYYFNNEKKFSENFSVIGKTPNVCVFEALLENDKESLNVLRKFRDEKLMKSEKGKMLVALYYKYSPMAVKFIEDKPEVKERLKQIIKTLIPAIKKTL